MSRPLDVLVISDHSDSLGLFPALFAGKPEMLAGPTGQAGTTWCRRRDRPIARELRRRFAVLLRCHVRFFSSILSNLALVTPSMFFRIEPPFGSRHVRSP
ncbi:DUF3604 domain-containing protein [Sinorhizobium fredii]|uniref:DUF3604 domain-containing protein n=1 Tax=Rhizobium fredii TaxID=380 RepID=UPI001F184A4F|nr:DUF3604 domain-containing protein [Sinorhizobium fredii]